MKLNEVKLLDVLKEGKSYAAVGRQFNVNESTVRYIKKKESEIRKNISMTYYGTAKAVHTPKEEEEKEPQPGLSSAPQGFQASQGWFQQFQKRLHLKSVSIRGEATSADKEAAMKYPEAFKKIIQEKGYCPEQVFNMDETGLFRKKMPSRTYLMLDEAKASGLKTQKDRLTLMMCWNAAGFMLKPGLFYKASNTRALKNKN
ncbi:tigger transposable element-derived protein 1-like [Macrobrachium nipponense]|uniref:tigger transposable element-derived protein 1-like n=1 Tax=Macrobrachium nipponense TaxID=159736 RepID=UPI0030C7B3AA